MSYKYPISSWMNNKKPKTAGLDSWPETEACHIHALIGETLSEAGHMHVFAGTTEPAVNGISHTHEYITATRFMDGHRHVIRARTGPAIPAQGGGHFHYIEGFTEGYPAHHHWFQGATTIFHSRT